MLENKKKQQADQKKKRARKSPFTTPPQNYSASQKKIQHTQNFFLSENKTLQDYRHPHLDSYEYRRNQFLKKAKEF